MAPLLTCLLFKCVSASRSRANEDCQEGWSLGNAQPLPVALLTSRINLRDQGLEEDQQESAFQGLLEGEHSRWSE